MIDLRRTLLQLSEDLIHKYDYVSSPSRDNHHSTDPILRFLLWLDSSAEAREALSKLGVHFHRPAYTQGRRKPADSHSHPYAFCEVCKTLIPYTESDRKFVEHGKGGEKCAASLQPIPELKPSTLDWDAI